LAIIVQESFGRSFQMVKDVQVQTNEGNHKQLKYSVIQKNPES